MKARLASLALSGLAIGTLQACESSQSPFPQRIDDNTYLFMVIPLNADITPEALAPAAQRASAFCKGVGKKYAVDVEPKTIVEAQQKMSAFYFSCCKAVEEDAEPQTAEEWERWMNKPYVGCE